MDKIKYYFGKYKVIIILFIVLIILGISIVSNIIEKDDATVDEELIEEKVKENKDIESSTKEDNKIVVDVKGMVVNPGVYQIDKNSRVLDAIKLAGGVSDEGNTQYLNLSKKITDEMVIIVYSNEEIKKFEQSNEKIVYIEKECECPDNINDACIGEKSKDSNNNLISINIGTLEELMTLPGIGESKARSIIEYREKNGEFKTLEELINVSGIGESVYSKIKDNIKL